MMPTQRRSEINPDLLSVLTQFIDLEESKWLEALERIAPQGTGELKKTFLEGRQLTQQAPIPLMSK